MRIRLWEARDGMGTGQRVEDSVQYRRSKFSKRNEDVEATSYGIGGAEVNASN